MEYMRTLPDKAFDLAIVDPPYRDENKAPTKWMRDSMSCKGLFLAGVPTDGYFAELERCSNSQIIFGANNFGRPFKGFISQNISVTVTTDTADTDEAVENRVKAILTELLAVRRSRKLNELTLSDINHAIRSGYSGATNAAVSEPEADVKLGKDKVITLGDVSVTVERE